jgi:hypothetical protein
VGGVGELADVADHQERGLLAARDDRHAQTLLAFVQGVAEACGANP